VHLLAAPWQPFHEWHQVDLRRAISSSFAVSLRSCRHIHTGISFYGCKVTTPPVWRKFNNVSHRNLKSKYEFRHCPVGNIVILFANLSSHSHLSWGQITCLGLICRRIGRNRIVVQRLSFRSLPYWNAKSGPLRFSTKSSYCSRPRVSKVKKDSGNEVDKRLGDKSVVRLKYCLQQKWIPN